MLSAWLDRLVSADYVDRSIKFRHVHQMIERLGLERLDPTVISIAGTNGKGSCVALLESIYSQAGYRVGAFTSPHLLQFNERIRICQQDADDEAICKAFDAIEKVRGDLQIGYFQFAFLAALILFQQSKLDIILLEVGIGGLYDAVNVVEPDLSVITQIGLDHCALLGNTRELIAEQKAGIMRSSKPTICGDLDPPASFLNAAKSIKTNLFCIQKDFKYEVKASDWVWQNEKNCLLHLPIPNLLLQNAATVLMAIECLQKTLSVSESAIKNGLQHIQLQGRQQLTHHQNISVLLDVAHNVDAATLLAKEIQQFNCQGKIRIVFGAMQDKDCQGIMRELSDCADAWYLTTLPNQRSLSSEDLSSILAELNIDRHYPYPAPTEAFDDAISQSGCDDLVIICGSFLTVAGVLAKISGNIM